MAVDFTIPDSAEAMQEFLTAKDKKADRDQIFSANADPKDLVAFMNAYAKHSDRKDPEVNQQVAEFTQAALLDLFRRGGAEPAPEAKRPSYTGDAKKGARHNKQAPGAGLDGKFTDLGEFVQSIWHRRTEGAWRPANNADLSAKLEIINAYQEKVPSDGGFLVPEEFRTEIMSLALESAIVRPRAQVIPMGTPTLSFPTVDATSNVSTVFGGIVVYRTEEGEEFVESQAKFARVKLDATKQTALAYLTNEVIKDTRGALLAWLMSNLPQAIGWYEDLDYLNGTGAGEPLGVLNAANPALLVIAKESGQTADTLVWENIIRMYSRMLPQSLGSAVWIASPDTFVELATMALTVGTGGSAVWLTDAHGAPQLTLLGRPVIMTEKAPGVLGTQGDLSFVDLSRYLIGDREGLSIETSAHVKFTSDQTTIRAIQRNDGRPAVLSAITPQNGGPTLSPFIVLDDRD
jgi:HK97 family phage major capsid protein